MSKKQLKNPKMMLAALVFTVFCVLGAGFLILSSTDMLPASFSLFPKKEVLEITPGSREGEDAGEKTTGTGDGSETSADARGDPGGDLGAELGGESAGVAAPTPGSAPAVTSSLLTFPCYVTGEVVKPGIVMLEEGDYLADAIAKAGGFTVAAAQEAVNLALRAAPEMHLHIPSKAEWAAEGAELPVLQTSPSLSPQETLATEAKVNLNLATKEELLTLPGVGEATALAILQYREEEGPFATVEDLMNVPGIKEAKFAKVKALITVG